VREVPWAGKLLGAVHQPSTVRVIGPWSRCHLAWDQALEVPSGSNAKATLLFLGFLDSLICPYPGRVTKARDATTVTKVTLPFPLIAHFILLCLGDEGGNEA
jgi:hypothetical protein